MSQPPPFAHWRRRLGAELTERTDSQTEQRRNGAHGKRVRPTAGYASRHADGKRHRKPKPVRSSALGLRRRFSSAWPALRAGRTPCPSVTSVPPFLRLNNRCLRLLRYLDSRLATIRAQRRRRRRNPPDGDQACDASADHRERGAEPVGDRTGLELAQLRAAEEEDHVHARHA